MAARASKLPLCGIKVLELSGLAPAPFAGMILSDFGAKVNRVDRAGDQSTSDTLARGKNSISLNLKSKRGTNIFKKLCKTTDILIEPFRPGVMEKMDLGPDTLCKENERLIYVRLNGFGSTGVYSPKAGHDINYLAISGVLSKLGRKGESPLPPVNLLGDFGGGSMIAVLGIMMALFERGVSGKGQVVDASITAGTAYLCSFLQRSRDLGIWFGDRGDNLLDGGAPFYQTYKTKDGKYMAVGAIEGKFYQKFIDGMCLTEELQNQFDIPKWPHYKAIVAQKFSTKTQDEWTELFEHKDACVTPVLDLSDAPLHPHNNENKTYMSSSQGNYEPCPQPILSRTPGISQHRRDPYVGEHSVEILLEEGFTQQDIDHFVKDGVVDQHLTKSSL